MGDYNRQVLQSYGSRGEGMMLPYSNDTIGFLVIHGDENLQMGDSFERLSTIMDKVCSCTDTETNLFPAQVKLWFA